MIDRACVVTLDKRLRAGDLGNAAGEFRRAGVPVDRLLVGGGELFPAGEYWWVAVEATPRRQAFNYASAFLKTIRHYRDQNAGPLLHLEDDAEMVPGWEPLLAESLRQLGEQPGGWDVLFVGGNYETIPPVKVAPNLLRCAYALDLHCCVIHPRCFDRLLRITPSAEHTLDGVLGQMMLRSELTVYGANPSLSFQRPCYSHNEGRWDNKVARHTWNF